MIPIGVVFESMKTTILGLWLGLVPMLVSVAVPTRAAEAGTALKIWRTGTFMDRVDGALGDGGANTYVAADGTVRLINLTDLTNDGNIDIVCPADHAYNQV